MIFYNPTDNDVLTHWIKYNPRSAFLMTQLGGVLSEEVKIVIGQISRILSKNKLTTLDANSLVTGRDFHSKIWKIALSVPIGIAVVSESMEQSTIANIFYEIGLMNALGKETLIVKTGKFRVPSDFVRTEYINFTKDFTNKFENFISRTFEQAEYYGIMADSLVAKPLLSIDYLRRAYLINENESYKQRATTIINENKFDEHTLLMIKNYFNIQS